MPLPEVISMIPNLIGAVSGSLSGAGAGPAGQQLPVTREEFFRAFRVLAVLELESSPTAMQALAYVKYGVEKIARPDYDAVLGLSGGGDPSAPITREEFYRCCRVLAVLELESSPTAVQALHYVKAGVEKITQPDYDAQLQLSGKAV